MRTSGILMHITSLPSPYGIGTMGAAAREFVDFLRAAGQTYWQILPICPTGFGDSPYQTFSSFAGNPYLIDFDDLQDAGLLRHSEVDHLEWGTQPLSVDYGLLYCQRFQVLRLACQRLLAGHHSAYDMWCSENAYWLEDYALFMALKDRHGGASWQEWEATLRHRVPTALAEVQEALSSEITFWKAVQYLFFYQWNALKMYANRRAVHIIGDLPIYVSADSAEVWADPNQFQLDQDLLPTEVAGCPPDGFSVSGQLWGNPLYNWRRMGEDNYAWWIRRIKYLCDIYDVLRIDHFRGVDSYYAIPFGAVDARNGRWRQGPGIKLFTAVKEALGERQIIAEDLGFLTPSVHALREETGFPGMEVLEFAFDSRDSSGSAYLPHNYREHCVAYIGTHDNDTALGWLKSVPPDDAAYAASYLRLNDPDGANWGMMRALWASTAGCTIVQMQDILGLGSEARMNMPSTVGRNWKWRAACGFDTLALAAKLRREMDLYCRLPGHT